MSYRVLIFGDRYWTEREPIRATITALVAKHGDVVVIEGEAPGADTIAREEAEDLGVKVDPYPAHWEVTEDTPYWRIRRRRDGTLYDVAAGPIRNQQMLDEGKPDEAVGFHHDITKSKGTADMLGRCEKAGVPAQIKPFDTRPEKAQQTLDLT